MWKYVFRLRKKILPILFLTGVSVLFVQYSSLTDLFQISKSLLPSLNNVFLIKKYTGKINEIFLWQSNSKLNKPHMKSQFSNKFELIGYEKSVDQTYHSQFALNSSDVIVFVHIQKTGGSTFNRHLVHDLSFGKCPKRKNSLKLHMCLRPNEKSEWLFSRFSAQLRSPCGLHPDITTLKECVPQYFLTFYDISTRYRYFYVTILREPTARFLSEWGHTRRGATWDLSLLQCRNEYFSHSPCWNGTDWKGVSLDDFLNCHHNWANNRMTWMLADLNRINCTGENLSSKEVNRILLETAKENLQKMSFFGINEKQPETQFMFEVVFNLRFKKQFALSSSTLSSKYKVTKSQMRLIKKRNDLDLLLYRFAVKLFDQRYRQMKSKLPRISH